MKIATLGKMLLLLLLCGILANGAIAQRDTEPLSTRQNENRKFDSSSNVKVNLMDIETGIGVSGALTTVQVISVTAVSARTTELTLGKTYKIACGKAGWFKMGESSVDAVHHVGSHQYFGTSVDYRTIETGYQYIAFVRDTDDHYCSVSMEGLP